jgi:hypothetical protein
MEGIFHYEYVPEGQEMNQHFYVAILKRMRLAACRKRSKKWESCAWAVHYGNATPRTADSVQVFLANHGIPVV